jgi:hypothetical protein
LPSVEETLRILAGARALDMAIDRFLCLCVE